MTDEQLDALRKARNALIFARQQQAKTIVISASEGTARAFADIQEGIEALDRAIEGLEEAEEEDDEEEDDE